MLVATWNINSVRMRLDRLLTWLEHRKPDIVCLQETKVVNEDFPAGPLNEVGYHCLVHGQKSYNGVAVLTRRPARDVVHSFPGDPDTQCRLLACQIDTMRVVNIYAPNGGEVGSDKYAYKLEWYARLRSYLDASATPEEAILVCGDFNVAPEDRDVWDPEVWRDQILFSEPEKAALRKLMEWGFADALRLHHPEGGLYTWWDYRGGAFHKGEGVRIDHMLISPPLVQRSREVEIDRNERKGEKPSDHAPLLATFDLPTE
jgi:exodeoxyribonuclease III